MHFWCRLLLHIVITLNLVRPSHVAQKVSSHVYLHGDFDYNDMPLAPLGCTVQLYAKPHRRNLWEEHSTNGYYIGSYNEYYSCHNIWLAETKAEIVKGNVFFKHNYITQSTLTPDYFIIKALHNFNHATKGTTNHKEKKL